MKQRGKSSSCSQEHQLKKGESIKTSTKSKTFKLGSVYLAFILVGYQLCLFVHHAAILKIEANRDKPDTVFVVQKVYSDEVAVNTKAESAKSTSGSGKVIDAGTKYQGKTVYDTVKKNATHSAVVKHVRARKVESFPFNPNTVSVEDLQRLGFSEKQAQSIDNYRQKGGRFYRASDFAKSYVVSDSVYARLKAYIRIPKTDINKADSAAFDALPGIGPYYAKQMVKYREQLGGYACVEQLLELYKFDEQRLASISDLIECSEPHYFELWNVGVDVLSAHPAIRNRSCARSILLYKENSAPNKWTIQSLLEAEIISEKQAQMLSRCVLH